jgi:hypothetical protein
MNEFLKIKIDLVDVLGVAVMAGAITAARRHFNPPTSEVSKVELDSTVLPTNELSSSASR